MNRIAQNIRKKRFDNGSLIINNAKKRFILEDNLPTGFIADDVIYSVYDINLIISFNVYRESKVTLWLKNICY